MKTLIVSDLLAERVPLLRTLIKTFSKELSIVSVTQYLMDGFPEKTTLRVLNLCQSYLYQSLGYYTSLLAEARKHRVLPSVLTIQDTECHTFNKLLNVELLQSVQHTLHPIQSDEFSLNIYFGKNIDNHYQPLCQKFYRLFPLPLFKVSFKRKTAWMVQKIVPLSLTDVPAEHAEFFCASLKLYLENTKVYCPKKRIIHYNMAILYSPEEVMANNYTAPSDLRALKKFIEAARELKIHAELIAKQDIKSLNEYDALFIRETTAVNHYTYRFARQALTENLVVVDDPSSILKCANKIYLAELLKKHHVSVPPTVILSKYNYKEKSQFLTYPCVLKLPDSACSKGVKKAEDLLQLKDILKEFFKKSELIIAQKFMPSDFDWRIGIFDNQPLFACRYFMTENHWQIYNWAEKSVKKQTGRIEALSLKEIPPFVLDNAIKASRLIGDGFYGVDLKQIGNKTYVIEVNDNPSVDHGLEDAFLGGALYHKIMQIFLQRMKQKHGHK